MKHIVQYTKYITYKSYIAVLGTNIFDEIPFYRG
jgi:hypothetical protein